MPTRPHFMRHEQDPLCTTGHKNHPHKALMLSRNAHPNIFHRFAPQSRPRKNQRLAKTNFLKKESPCDLLKRDAFFLSPPCSKRFQTPDDRIGMERKTILP